MARSPALTGPPPRPAGPHARNAPTAVTTVAAGQDDHAALPAGPGLGQVVPGISADRQSSHLLNLGARNHWRSQHKPRAAAFPADQSTAAGQAPNSPGTLP